MKFLNLKEWIMIKRLASHSNCLNICTPTIMNFVIFLHNRNIFRYFLHSQWNEINSKCCLLCLQSKMHLLKIVQIPITQINLFHWCYHIKGQNISLCLLYPHNLSWFVFRIYLLSIKTSSFGYVTLFLLSKSIRMILPDSILLHHHSLL
jgi:hypothetical protein